MVRVFSRSGRRRALAAVALGALIVGSAPAFDAVGAGAAEASVSVDCTGDADDSALQDALNDTDPATEGGPTTEIVISGVCEGEYFVPDGATVHLRGDGSDDEEEDALDGMNEVRPLTAGTVDLTLSDLFVQNGYIDFETSESEPAGGGLLVVGDSQVVIDNVVFRNNEANGGLGGGAAIVVVDESSVERGAASAAVVEDPAVVIRDSTFGGIEQGNIATEIPGGDIFSDLFSGIGGGLAVISERDVQVENSEFSHNRGVTGGGGAALMPLAPIAVEIRDNTFDSNILRTTSPGCSRSHVGGGLLLAPFFLFGGPAAASMGAFELDDAPTPPEEAASARQVGNVFSNNTIEPAFTDSGMCQFNGLQFDQPEGSDGVGFVGGGGEWISDVFTASRDDQYLNNSIANVFESEGTIYGEAEGGGLGVFGQSPEFVFYGENLVAAGNEIREADGSGGGIYLGTTVDTTLHLVNSTVSGNVVDAPSVGGGIGGGDDADHVVLENSIVWGNVVDDGEGTSPSDIAAVASVTATNSDVCVEDDGGAPLPGDGNICEDPLLVDAEDGDVHQTADSPTRDAGSNELVPADLDADYEGDARMFPSVVDMGADEFIYGADLSATKSVTPASVKVGEEFTYTVTATNNGPEDAVNLTITDPLPAEVTFVSATPSAGGTCGTVPAVGSTGTVACSWAGATAAGVTRTVTIVVRAADVGSVLNTATASSATSDPISANDAGSAVAVLGSGELRPGDGVTPPGSIGVGDGYCLTAEDGGVFTFGACEFLGAAATGPIIAPQSKKLLNAPMVGQAMTPNDDGYWMAGADGGVFTFGAAKFLGSMGATRLTSPIVGIAASPTGNGYYLVAGDGGVFTFGDAAFLGSMGGQRLNAPIANIVVTPSGKGYWLVAADGGVFSFGDATFFGSMGGRRLNAPIVGMASRPGGLGYWLVATDGGIFSFGDAPFFGSMGATRLTRPIMAMKSTSTGLGYYLVGNDGGVFTFGDAPFLGSMGGTILNQPVVDMTG